MRSRSESLVANIRAKIAEQEMMKMAADNYREQARGDREQGTGWQGAGG